jgi:hypothetical protein
MQIWFVALETVLNDVVSLNTPRKKAGVIGL